MKIETSLVTSMLSVYFASLQKVFKPHDDDENALRDELLPLSKVKLNDEQDGWFRI